MQMIKCEITKVFSANDKGIGFAIKPDAITDEVKQLKTWNEKFKTLTATWWFNKKPQPRWIIEGAEIQFNWSNKNGYLEFDRASVETLSLPEEIEMSEEEKSFNQAVDELSDEAVAEIIEKEHEIKTKPTSKQDRKIERIKQLVANYGDVFKIVNAHENLVSLDTCLKKDIATHINITLTNEGY